MIVYRPGAGFARFYRRKPKMGVGSPKRGSGGEVGDEAGRTAHEIMAVIDYKTLANAE
jgi:hypothetical protein